MVHNGSSSCGFLSYRMFSKLLVLLQAILLMSGCAAFSGFPQRATDPNKDLQLLESHIGAEAITGCLTNPTVSCRNEIITARMFATDIRFSEFEESLFRQTRETGFGATLATLGLTSGAAFAGGITSQVLAGVAAFIIGAREAFQKEVLAERTVVAIHTAMRANRARTALRIRLGLSQSIDQYPLGLGLSDLNDYYNAGTVLGALIGITETVGVQAREAEEELQKEIRFSLDPAAQSFEQAVCGGVPNCPNPDATKFDAIRACWPAAGVQPSTFMTDFILQKNFARQRALVAACMKLTASSGFPQRATDPKMDLERQKFDQAICGGVPNCPNPDTVKFDDIRACWPTVGVPKETLMTDFILQERFARQRALVATCMKL